MNISRLLAPAGTLHTRVTRGYRGTGSPWTALRAGLPWFGQPSEVWRYRLRNLPNLLRGFWKLALADLIGVRAVYGTLAVMVRRANGEVVNLGIVSLRVVTTAGVGYIVDAFQNIVEPEIMKYHGVGVTNTAEAVGDTALASESTTIINPDSTRATGTTVEGASANIYRTVGTVTFDGSGAIVEHGVFNQAATGGGVLLDRTVFSTINVANLDSIQFTYELTFTAGS